MTKKKIWHPVILCLILSISTPNSSRSLAAQEKVFPGAEENSVSLAHYFTWINNTSGGATQEQTFINLDFFQWLFDEYGMQLDTYAFDADILDGGGFYRTMKSEKFLKNFPDGFGPVMRKAKSMGIRLGVWLGPDGFGDTDREEQERIDMLVSLCRDYNFRIFKMDLMLSQLRPEKQDSLMRALKACREFTPDLIVLNHRVDFGKAAPYVTTTLWNGDETYIDVHMTNTRTATHHRAEAVSRGLVPGLERLKEDHGVCLSSCLDYWEDDLVMQAFNRSLLLAPELYGNPWLLRDDEYSRLARMFNIHRRYRDILVNGIVLPKDQYGENAVSRGDGNTRLLTLSNLSWESVRYQISLDESIGLEKAEPVNVVQCHPYEEVLGRYEYGRKVTVEVLPFRSCLLLISTSPLTEVSLSGCSYEMVQNVPDRDVRIKLLGFPATKVSISLLAHNKAFSSARLDGQDVSDLLLDKALGIQFPGNPLNFPWHRKLGDLQKSPVPEDADSLYEAACFAADNNALEVRSLQRSGPTRIPQVQRARDAFFNQPVFIQKGVWDKFLFDGDDKTAFRIHHRLRDYTGGALRVDFGLPIQIDRLIIQLEDDQAVRTFIENGGLVADVSADLKVWRPAKISSSGYKLKVDISADTALQYFRLEKAPDAIVEIQGTHEGIGLDRTAWRASNLFGWYPHSPAMGAWAGSFYLDEAPKGSYLAVPLEGIHGRDGAFAALRIGDKILGAPDRSPSYMANVWEYRVQTRNKNYTYYFPVTPEMIGKKIEVIVLGLNMDMLEIMPEVWITAYPIPFKSKELVLKRRSHSDY